MCAAKVETACAILLRATRIVVFSGAGMSAESGIETFRGSSASVWASRIVLALFGTPFGWRWMPGISWRLYNSKFRDAIARAHPNDGHQALAYLERYHLFQDGRSGEGQLIRSFTIITQNVDGLHQRSGSESVFELHGTINSHICIANHHLHNHHVDPKLVTEDPSFPPFDPLEDSSLNSVECDQLPPRWNTMSSGRGREIRPPSSLRFYDYANDPFFQQSPKCESCGSFLRPNATLFTEALPEDAVAGASRCVDELEKGDVVIVVGTSGVVYPAAGFIQRAIAKPGVVTIEINPVPAFEAEISAQGGILFKQTCAEALSHILASYEEGFYQQLEQQ